MTRYQLDQQELVNRKRKYQETLEMQLKSKRDEIDYMKLEKDRLRGQIKERADYNRSQEMQMKELRMGQQRQYKKMLDDQSMQSQIISMARLNQQYINSSNDLGSKSQSRQTNQYKTDNELLNFKDYAH
ncbi:UNKNOWN [Stylonychia lemnae]|uniref:Uncharacterized protein n=1 Tax=Stylonychia lemnae TaxID=5949 RepID=A0A078B9C7_STYLE|nr:UNKNOWN [Stylonychia lemnae]|eukprot:CDW90821.1 UNKNOWN [Stylonychia lemnae]